MLRDDLAAEIVAMAGDDQRARHAISEVGAAREVDAARAVRLGETDAANVARLREIVAGIGWPTRSKVGERAEHRASLLVQHADLAFQERCLALMKDAAPNEVCPQHIAYLEDRIAVKAGRAQRYGTQLRIAGDRLEPYPVADATAVDELRRSVGLEPLKTYVTRARSPHIG